MQFKDSVVETFPFKTIDWIFLSWAADEYLFFWRLIDLSDFMDKVKLLNCDDIHDINEDQMARRGTTNEDTIFN